MNIQPRFRRLGLRCLWLLACGLAVLGYWDAFRNERSSRAQESAARHSVQEWHAQMASELPADQRRAWLSESRENPFLLLGSVALEHKLNGEE